MSDLKCWTRYNNKGGKYITCEDNSKKKKSNTKMVKRTNEDRLRQLAIDRDNLLNTERLMEQTEEEDLDLDLDLDNFEDFLTDSRRNLVIPDLLEANEQLDYDIIPMDLSRGSTQRRVEEEDRRQQFLQRDRRNRFLDMTSNQDSRERRETFTRTLSNPNEFMGKTQKQFKPPQIPVEPRYLKRMEKTKKQIAEKNYKSKQAEYRAKRTERFLGEYLEYDRLSKQAKTQEEYDEYRRLMDIGDFMKWERYGKMKAEKYKKKKSLLEV